MILDNAQVDYWDRAAASKTFTHPLDLTLLARHVAPSASVLDYGCGQGRLCGALLGAGYQQVTGVDYSAAMIAAARQAWPTLRFEVIDAAGLRMPPASVDCVLLFAVLTCIPQDDAQRSLMAELARVLRPGGFLLVSDVLLQDDARSVERYRLGAAQGHPHGVFRTDDGAWVRHHSRAWMDTLFAAFRLLETRNAEITTMNGNRSICTQWVLQKPA